MTANMDCIYSTILFVLLTPNLKKEHRMPASLDRVKFQGFLATENDNTSKRVVFTIYRKYNSNRFGSPILDEDADLEATAKEIENAMPRINYSYKVSEVTYANCAIETLDIGTGTSKLRQLMHALRLYDNGSIDDICLENTEDLSDITLQIRGDYWYVDKWELRKYKYAELTETFASKHFSPDLDLENESFLICDEVVWTNGSKSILFIAAWVFYID